MSRRKLSQNQTRRVKRMHAARADLAASAPERADGSSALVISRFGKQADIVDERDPRTIIRCHLRANLGSLVAGDRVIWRAEPGGAVVVARLDRSSELARPDATGKLRPVAANLDQILIVIAPEPTPHANLLDRYLVAATDAGIDALIVLNKIDLLAEPTALDGLLADYRAIGCRVLHTCARLEHGLDELRAALAGHVSAVVGQSGVGKSSLVAALLPDESVRVGELSEAEIKGRHTTSAARLYHLPHGGTLIDSPGIREFGLTHLDPARTAAGFIEFRPFIGQCRFRDCEHGEEPGCAIRKAVEQQQISARRYASYLQIAGLCDGVSFT